MPKITRTHLIALFTLVAGACTPSSSLPPQDLGFPVNATLIAQGSCEGRAGHDCTGTIGLYRRAEGTLVIGLQSNFRSTDVPGPRLYYSSRSSLGSGIDTQTDIRLDGGPNNEGLLWNAVGAQGYPVPTGAEAGRSYFWIWCEPFGVEVARAELIDLSTAQ